MSKKYSSSTLDQSSLNTNSTMMKLITVKGNEQDQFKKLQRVETVPHMHTDVDAPSPSSTLTTISPPPTNIQNQVGSAEKPLKDSSSTPKRNHKHKHHHHHHGGKHHHHLRHHHNHRRRAKSAEIIRNRQHQTILSPLKLINTNPQNNEQKSMIVYREVPNDEDYTIDDTNNLYSVSCETKNEITLGDDQQAPLIVYRDDSIEKQPKVTNRITQPVSTNKDQEINTSKRNVTLQSIENKILSQRAAPVNETQVGNYSSMICNPSTPPMICSQSASPMICSQCNPSIINTGAVQQVEQIYYDDNYCVPSPTTSDSYIVQQANPLVCVPQQQHHQQQQILYCTDSNLQDFLCTQSGSNTIQQTSLPQQQRFICVDNTPSTAIQPTIINQIPFLSSLSTNAASQTYICVPQTPVQQTASIIIHQQQPQIQSQPLQIIQNPQTQPGQYLQISSTTPQFIQSVQPPLAQAQSFLQTMQAPAQNFALNPQMLYQRPYDPIVLPFQNQQIALANAPVMAMSQPSYAPARIVSAAPAPQSRGPNMFRHALVRTVANQTGLPVLSPSAGGLQLVQPPMVGPPPGPLVSTARHPIDPFNASVCSIM